MFARHWLNLVPQRFERHRASSGPGRDRDISVFPQVEALEERTLLSWVPVASLPTPRFGLAAATATNGLIYAVGGADSPDNRLTTVEAYRTGNNTWARGAPLINNASQLGAAATLDGRIVALAGQAFAGFNIGAEAYTPTTDTWAYVANLQTYHAGFGVATGRDQRIYVISGFGYFGITNLVEVYTPSSNSWAYVASLPTPRVGLAAATAPDGRIYAIGGADGSGLPLATVEVYDPRANRWDPVANLPTPRVGLAAATGADGRIYAIGGINDRGALVATVEVYDPRTNRWTTGDSLPAPRTGLAAATGLDGRIYAIGGRNATGVLATVDALPTVTAVATTSAGGPVTSVSPSAPEGAVTLALPVGTNAVDPPAPESAVSGTNAGSSRNQLFVAQIYRDLLHREADPVGLAAFTNLLQGGQVSRSQVALAIENSPEHQALVVEQLYNQLLGRAADPVGLAGWIAFLAQGGTTTQLEANLLGSQEYFLRHGGTADSYLAAVYQDVLHRAIDPAGASFWKGSLDGGRSRSEVAGAILLSSEADRLEVQQTYQEFLKRPADAAGLASFVGALQTGTSLEVLLATVAGSEEYFERL